MAINCEPRRKDGKFRVQHEDFELLKDIRMC